jgi:Mlc titration factor MtfA (ptsG expression regulator)
MPGDTTYIINGAGDTIRVIIPGVTGHIVRTDTIAVVRSLGKPEPPSQWWLTFPFALIAFIFLVPLIAKWFQRGVNNQKAKRVYLDKQVVYSNILERFNPYYNNLPPDLKKNFLKRTLNFMTSKRFKYVEMEGEEHMPLLVSAAAVQLTFGLENYLLDHFDTIYILRSDYNYGLYNVPFQGHVNNNGIYLSWNNFLKAFANYNDGDNVGLHEMAHALSYVNFIANDGSDNGFKERFKQFSVTGRAIFKQVQEGGSTFLGNYAGTNYEEFWAVCVENFFERPSAFRLLLPELYQAMCNLLNQDMLAPGLFVQPVELAY